MRQQAGTNLVRGERGKALLEIAIFGTLIGIPLALFLNGGRTLNLSGDAMTHTQIVLGVQAGSANLMEEDQSGISTYTGNAPGSAATISVDRIRYLMRRDLPSASSECAEVYRATRLPDDPLGVCSIDWTIGNQGDNYPGCVLPAAAKSTCETQIRRSCMQPQSEIYAVCASAWNSTVSNSLRAAMIPNVTLLVIPAAPVGGGSSSSSSSSGPSGSSGDPADPDLAHGSEAHTPFEGFHPFEF